MRTRTQALDGAMAKLPPGWPWPASRDSDLGRLLTPLADEAVQFEQAAEAQLAEVDPGQAGPLLEDYERVLGGDPCRAAGATVADRQRSALQRWTARGGASRAFFIGVAAQLGYSITITEFRRLRFGQAFGRPFYGRAWASAWQVTTEALTTRPFRFGEGRFGEPFVSWGRGVLECVLHRIKPEHTTLTFNYVRLTGAPLGEFILGRDVLVSRQDGPFAGAALGEFELGRHSLTARA